MAAIIQSLTDRAVFQSLRTTTLSITGSACAIGGLVADVLQPIAPFASYLFYVSFIALSVLLYLLWKGKEDFLGAAAFAGVACAVFGLITLFQVGEESQEVGFVAATVPSVASLQERLGLIDQKLDRISEDTTSLRASAERIEESNAQIIRSIEEMRQSFASDELIGKPRSPEQHYRNARIHELAGNYSAARQAYLAYFKSDLPLLDPHLRFLSFLRVQEGRASARETYNLLMQGRDNAATNYIRLLLLEPPVRMGRLLAYAEENTDFAPVFYHLSEEVSERRLGFQTIANKQSEREYLNNFLAADKAGGLLKHMIDQSLVDSWREDVATRLQTLNAVDAAALENPVSVSFGVNNSGYAVTVLIAEPAKEIFWRTGSSGELRSTGSTGQTNLQTGLPAPKQFFNLPINQRDTTVEVSYLDLNDVEQGPFSFPFKGKKESADANQRILESTGTSWVSFRDFNGKRLLYFSHLMTYRGSLKEIRYGLNSGKPSRRYRFPAWRKAGIAPIDEKTPLYIEVPRSTRYATVQLTYKDESKSAVQRFDYVRQN
ncbi:MAG: hypothetical protein AAF098_17685 [Pseudomonadota bacterium]